MQAEVYPQCPTTLHAPQTVVEAAWQLGRRVHACEMHAWHKLIVRFATWDSRWALARA